MLAKIHFSGRLEPIHGSPVVTACGRFGYYDKCGEMVYFSWMEISHNLGF